MTPPRLPPVSPPLSAELAALLDSLRLGRPEPIMLFRTLAHAPRVLERVKAGGLLDKGPVPLRLREIAILRTTARCGAGYEWGVHVAGFSSKAGLSPADVNATAKLGPRDHTWTDEEALVIELADELHDTSHVSNALYARLTGAFAADVMLELISLVGFYHLISFQVNALGLTKEAFAPPLPSP
jgi:hypothetical protein